jgi:hypothetical protein
MANADQLDSDADGIGDVCESADPPTSVPEFPTMALPATLIVGFIGVVFFIREYR